MTPMAALLHLIPIFLTVSMRSKSENIRTPFHAECAIVENDCVLSSSPKSSA